MPPGKEYPVFDTRFGKVGMMVCYDGFFPEVARELTNRGAEVIAWPVWGCNPMLASARACENHVYMVSSTYEDVSRNWMITADLRPRRPTAGQGRKVGHGRRGRGGPGPAAALDQPGRLQSGTAPPPATGQKKNGPRSRQGPRDPVESLSTMQPTMQGCVSFGSGRALGLQRVGRHTRRNFSQQVRS